MSSDEDQTKEQAMRLGEAVKDLEAACYRRNKQEMELRACLGQVALEWKKMTPFLDLIRDETRNLYVQQVEALEQRALKYIRAINPKLITLQDAIGTEIPIQGVSQTRSRRDDEPLPTSHAPPRKASGKKSSSGSKKKNTSSGEKADATSSSWKESGASGPVTTQSKKSSEKAVKPDPGKASELAETSGNVPRTDEDPTPGPSKQPTMESPPLVRLSSPEAGPSKLASQAEARLSPEPSKRLQVSDDEVFETAEVFRAKQSKQDRKERRRAARSRRDRAESDSSSRSSSSSSSSESEATPPPKKSKKKSKSSRDLQKKEKASGLSDALPKSLLTINKKHDTVANKSSSKRRNSLPYERLPAASFRGRGNSVGNYLPDSFANRCGPSGDRRMYGAEFCRLDFPEYWQLPTLREFERDFTKVDVVAMSVRPEAFGFFDGSAGEYYTWRSKFVRMVHVQKVHVIHKACALDQSVSARIRSNLFEGLETTHQDYLLRIRRLEDHYGGDESQLDNMLRRISELRDVRTDDQQKVQRAVYALEKCLASADNPGDRHLMRMIRPELSRKVLKGYNTHRWDWNKPDSPGTLKDYLNRFMRVELDTYRNFRPSRSKAAKPKKAAKKKAVKKKDKKKKSKKDKKGKDSYQFFHAGSSGESSDSSLSSSSSLSDSSSCESDEPSSGQLNTQKGNTQCGFCQGLHVIFKCIKFFCELNCEERRDWVEKESKCPLCFESGHDKDDCSVRRFCRFCGGRHNSTIHVKKVSKPAKPTKPVKAKKAEKPPKTKAKKADASESDEGLVHSFRAKPWSKTSLTTFVCQIRNPTSGRIETLNALADGGADHSVVSSRAAKRLGLWTESGGHRYSVKGHGGNSSVYDARSFAVQLLNPEGRKVREIRVKSYDEPCGDLKVENWKQLKMNWPHLRRLDIPAPAGDGIVDLILGSSGLDLMEAVRPVQFGPAGGPVAKYTQLGWVVGGKTCPLFRFRVR